MSCHDDSSVFSSFEALTWKTNQKNQSKTQVRLSNPWIFGGNFTPPLFSSHSCLATKTRFIPIWPNWKAQAWRIYTCGGHMQGRLVKFPHMFFHGFLAKWCDICLDSCDIGKYHDKMIAIWFILYMTYYNIICWPPFHKKCGEKVPVAQQQQKTSAARGRLTNPFTST